MTPQEYNRCVDKHADGIYRFVLHHIRHEADAQDIVQDSFEKMWKHHTNIQNEKAKSYLFTTAYHTMIDKINKNKRSASLDEVNYTEPSYSNQYSDAQEHLQTAVNKLPEVQRSVLLLRDYEGYSYDEISEITGLSLSQVKVYIYRARIFLKEYIGSMAQLI